MTGPTVPTRRAFAGVFHGDDRRRLRQTVAFENLDAGADEERRELRRQRRAAGDHELHPAAQPLVDLLEDELVGDLRLDRKTRRHRPVLDAIRKTLGAHAQRPVEQLLPDRRHRGDVVHDPRAHLLEEPRHRGEDVRLHLGEVVGDFVHVLGVGDRQALVQIEEVGHALEDVRQRQDRHRDLAGVELDELATSPATLLVMLPCVSIAPLGLPVVPDV